MQTSIALPRAEDLFSNDLGSWSQNPKLAFTSWMLHFAKEDGINFSKNSIKVYSSMWSTFISHLRQRNIINPTKVQQADIIEFLNNAKACRRTEAKKRYTLVLQRAFSAMGKLDASRTNPVEGIVELSGSRVPDEPMPFLTGAERERLYAALSLPSNFDTEAGRILARSKALCALMLGAGFKPGQALASSVNCVSSGDRFATAPQIGQMRERRSLIDHRALIAIDSWQDYVHARSGHMFPGAQSLSPRSIHYVRMFRGVKTLLAKLELNAGGERSSPQTLRNSYGAELIDRGVGIEAICEYMGFTRLDFAQRFVHGYKAWCRRMEQSNQSD